MKSSTTPKPYDYQVIDHGWPIQDGFMVPVGTLLRRDDWTYLGVPLPETLPSCLMPLHQEAYLEMIKTHPRHVVRTTNPEIVR
jgi:hypothetical protein